MVTRALATATIGRRLDLALFLLLAVAWGSSFLGTKVAVHALPPISLVAMRMAFAALVLMAVVVVVRPRRPTPREIVDLAILGLLTAVVPSLLFAFAQRDLSSAAASVLNATTPILVISIGAAVLPGERLRPAAAVGVVIGFLGVVAMMNPFQPSAGFPPVPTLAVVLAGLGYALGAIHVRRSLRDVPAAVIATAQAVSALVVTAPLALVLDGVPAEVPWSGIAAAAWLGIVASAAGYLIYFRLLNRWGPSRVTLVNYVLPLVGIGLGVTIAGEPLDPQVLAGGALVLAGVAAGSGRVNVDGIRASLAAAAARLAKTPVVGPVAVDAPIVRPAAA